MPTIPGMSVAAVPGPDAYILARTAAMTDERLIEPSTSRHAADPYGRQLLCYCQSHADVPAQLMPRSMALSPCAARDP